MIIENIFSDSSGVVFIKLSNFNNNNNYYVLIKFDDLFTYIGLGNSPKILFFDSDMKVVLEKYKELPSENVLVTNKVLDPLKNRYIKSETYDGNIYYHIQLLKRCLGNSDLLNYLKDNNFDNIDELY